MRINSQAAVIDRIVDGKTAVLLVGAEQSQLLVPVADLPSGSKEGLWLQVQIKDGKLMKAEIDQSKTDEMKERISAKRALLLQRKPRR